MTVECGIIKMADKAARAAELHDLRSIREHAKLSEGNFNVKRKE